MQELFRPAGTAADGQDPVLITPERAGWDHAGLRVLRLPAGGSRQLATGDHEMAVLPLAGAPTVEVGGRTFALQGRDYPWAGVTDWVYLPRDAEARLSCDGPAEVALPGALATRGLDLDPVHIPAAEVEVEVRGAGQATRTVVNFCNPEAFPADSLLAVEVYTPEGNWSSYPPHKHDGRPGSPDGCEEAVLEEIYYFRIRGENGFGLHRTYAADGSFDQTVTVRDGDVFLVPHGFHGPCVAAPGYDMYYLNVLAGPREERTMAFCTDPAHLWLWESWQGAGQDPRCPVVTAP